MVPFYKLIAGKCGMFDTLPREIRQTNARSGAWLTSFAREHNVGVKVPCGQRRIEIRDGATGALLAIYQLTQPGNMLGVAAR